MPVDADEAAAMSDLNFPAVAAGPPGADHLPVARGDDRTSPARSDVDAGVEAGEMKDRMIAIAEVGGDRPVGRHHHRAFDWFGPCSIGGVNPFAAPASRPFDQLKV